MKKAAGRKEEQRLAREKERKPRRPGSSLTPRTGTSGANEESPPHPDWIIREKGVATQSFTPVTEGQALPGEGHGWASSEATRALGAGPSLAPGAPRGRLRETARRIPPLR